MNDLNTPVFLSELAYDITPSSFKVYISLRIRQNVSNECYPSINTIAQDTRLSKQTIINAIKQLEAMRLVKVVRQRIAAGMNEVNRYKCMNVPAIIKREEVVKNIDQGSQKNVPGVVKNLDPKIKNTKIKSESNTELDELKAIAKAQGSYVKIRRDKMEEHLKNYALEDIKAAIISASEHNKKNEIRTWLSKGHIEFYLDRKKVKRAAPRSMTEAELAEYYKQNKMFQKGV